MSGLSTGPALDPGLYGRGMTSKQIGVVWRPYLRALAETGLDVASVGAWVAAAELPPPRRRLARGALAAVAVAVAIPGVRADRPAAANTAGSGLPVVDAGIRIPADEPFEADGSPRRRAVLAGAVGVAALTTAVAVSVGAAAGSRRLERRWLARLTRHGHPHPHRALGVRMAALYAVLVVPGRLLAVRKGTEADHRDTVPASGDGRTVSE